MENENGEINYEPKKACCILIYNCISQDMIDVNIYSILNANSSFIIIYDIEQSIFNQQELKKLKDKTNIANETNQIKIIFRRNAAKINMEVPKNINISQLLILYILKTGAIESYINNLLFIYNQREIAKNSSQSIDEIFKNTKNPCIKVIDRNYLIS